jgi:hypothetical protein
MQYIPTILNKALSIFTFRERNAYLYYILLVLVCKIASGYLPRVRLEYDRLSWQKNTLRAELNAWKFEIDNAAKIYQGFCDRNLRLCNREGELKRNIGELEAKKTEMEKTTIGLRYSAEVRENNLYNNNVNL